MPRQTRRKKPLIYAFYEGETEQAYLKFLKNRFSDVAVIKYPQKPFKTSLFEQTEDKFAKDPKYCEAAEVIDEIWLFFDVEEDKVDEDTWAEHIKIIRHLRRLKKKPGIRVRLLMTKACIEYWLLLHYEMTAPPIRTPADKNRIEKRLLAYAPAYVKGDETETKKIAQQYKAAVQRGEQLLNRLLAQGLPVREDTDARSKWLYLSDKTFTTVQEAIQFLESC